jgi:hypothetical protein
VRKEWGAVVDVEEVRKEWGAVVDVEEVRKEWGAVVDVEEVRKEWGAVVDVEEVIGVAASSVVEVQVWQTVHVVSGDVAQRESSADHALVDSSYKVAFRDPYTNRETRSRVVLGRTDNAATHTNSCRVIARPSTLLVEGVDRCERLQAQIWNAEGVVVDPVMALRKRVESVIAEIAIVQSFDGAECEQLEWIDALD